MLYISRFVGSLKVGVVDTDDGTESIVTLRELDDYVLRLGLDIKGVTVAETQIRKRMQPYIDKIDVYQHSDNTSVPLMKLKLGKAVDIKVYDGVIVSVYMKRGVVPPDTVIRLSDYGSSCGKYIFRSMDFNWNVSPCATVILDDKCQILANTFKDFFLKALILDIRECTSVRALDIITKEMLNSSTLQDGIKNGLVLATQQQLDYMNTILLLNKAQFTNNSIRHIDDMVHDVEYAHKVVERRYFREFEGLAKSQFMWNENCHVQWMRATLDFISWLRKGDNFKKLESRDYIVYRIDRFNEIFTALRDMSTVNKSALQRFENYMNYFNPDERMQDAYKTLVYRGCTWALNMSVEHSLIKG